MSSDAGPDGGRSLRVEPAHSWARAESSGIGADCRCSRHSEAASVASKWSLTKDGVPPEEELEDVLDAVMRQRGDEALAGSGRTHCQAILWRAGVCTDVAVSTESGRIAGMAIP